ncbi:MAG: hypothetical protein JNL87_14445 [Burkholderiaceae bacterium]|nr:hypothetical protein [Burkholderiaceae bacterium]
MPTLEWLNRDAAFRIAEQVPTRVLRPHRAAPAIVGDAAVDSGNLLIHGDNLEALNGARRACSDHHLVERRSWQ